MGVQGVGEAAVASAIPVERQMSAGVSNRLVVQAERRRRKAARVAARLVVRAATPGDLVPLQFFFDALLRRDYFLRRGQLKEILHGPHHRVYVAEIDAVLVGAAILTAGTRLVNVLVHPAYRGLGIGRELVNGSGASELRAKLDMSSGDPRGFYESLGFAPTGRRNGKGNIELMRRPAARGPRGQGAEGAARVRKVSKAMGVTA